MTKVKETEEITLLLIGKVKLKYVCEEAAICTLDGGMIASVCSN